MLQLFKLINLRSIKDNYYTVIFVLLGCIVSSSLLAATIFTLDNIDSYVNKSARLINHGELSVSQENLWFGEKQYRINNKKFDDFLENCNDIDYTFEQLLMPDAAATLGIEGGKTIVGSEYWYRFINFDDLNRYSNNISKPAKNTVILSETMSKRLSADIGDVLNIKFDTGRPVLSCSVSLIIPDNEINIERAYVGYIMLDLSEYTNWLINVAGAEQDYDFENAWIKKYYIDGNKTQLQSIAYKANEIFGKNSKTVFIDNLFEQAKTYFSFPIAFFSFFTLVCFILSSIGLFNLCYIRMLNRQNDIAILKIYGLSNGKNLLSLLLELLILVLPAYLTGIGIGYIIFRVILYNTTTLGVFSLSGFSILISIIKIVTVNLVTSLLVCIPVIIYVFKRKICDVLRDNSAGKTVNSQVVLSIVSSCILIMLLFNLVVDSKDINSLLFKIIVVACAMLILSKLATKLLYFIRTKSYLHISLAFIRKDKIKVPIIIMTYSFCFSMVFMLLMANYSLYLSANDASILEHDYNVEVEVTEDMEDAFNKFITNELKVNNFYIINEYAIDFKELYINFDVYDFRNYDGVMNEKIGKKISVSNYIRSLYGINEDDTITLSIQEDLEPISFKVGKEPYKAPFPGGPRQGTAIVKEAVPYLTEKADTIAYFFNLTNTEEQMLRDYAEDYGGLQVISTEEAIEARLGEIMDYRYIFGLMTFYFLICTFVTVLSSSIVTYIDRKKEFCVFKVYGATDRTLKKMILFENFCYILIAIIYGNLIISYCMEYISTILNLEIYKDNFLMLLLGISFIFIALLNSILVNHFSLNRTGYELLREE